MSSVLDHLEQLKWKHRTLDNQIEKAYNNYAADEDIKAMKHERFLLKEQIRLLETEYGKDIQNC